jgi:predicted acylesterase/phospholipase RssA
MTGTGEHKHAVVLSGGGANGAYEVGVLKALFTGRAASNGYEPLDPDIFTGTSIGSYNVAFLVSQWERYGQASVSNLETTWLTQVSRETRSGSNGGYRFLANPLEFFDPRRFLSDPIEAIRHAYDDGVYLLWDFIDRFMYVVNPQDDEPMTERFLHTLAVDTFISREPFDRLVREVVNFEAIRHSPKVLKVAATNWETGRVEEFVNHDFTDKLGPRILMASSAIPGFFTPQQVGAQPYVDGSVLMNTPLNPAIRAGADCLHVVYLDPDVSSIPIHYLSNLLSTLYRTQVINWAHTVNESIKAAESINRTLALIESARRDAGAPGASPQATVHDLGRFGGQLEGMSRYRPLEIHRYHPRDELGGPLSLLDVRRARIEYLIERGFSDAAGHNCVHSKCVLPSAAPAGGGGAAPATTGGAAGPTVGVGSRTLPSKDTP